ncbi:purine and uridine phosphorylase [Trichoderma ceciliae]
MKNSRRARTHPRPNSLTPDCYTVGWICALDVELAASVAMLDQELPKLPQAQGDSNAYTLGRMGQHHVVLACLPAGTTGTNAAATAATNMLRSFPNISIGLMVGIGGGAPSLPSVDPREDLRLGDVVVSCAEGDSGGVVQYDFGKTMREGKFVQTGSLNKTSVALSTGVSKLRARHKMEESKIPQYVDNMLQSNRKMRQYFHHPGLEHDQLFRAEYEHVDGEPNCQSCDRRALLIRQARENQDPIIHYGLIGSANQVMKHGATREKLRQDKGIICFEMEAAGLMYSFPCLVVRGICDYADSHKNKKWQPYAAATAAAYAKEILSVIPATEVTKISGVDIYDMLQSTVSELNLNQLLNILSAAEQEYHISAIPRLDCDDPMFHWVFRNIDFMQWNSTRGPPVLCLSSLPERQICRVSSYIADQQKKAGHPVMQIFCSTVFQGKAIEHNSIVARFVHTILQQLIRCSPMDKRILIIRSFFNSLLQEIFPNKKVLNWKAMGFDDKVDTKNIKNLLTIASMNDLLIALLRALDCGGQPRLVVIDGLDMIDSVNELIRCIRSLIEHLQQRDPKVKILITGLPSVEIMDFFREFLYIEHNKERNECLASLQFDNTRYYKISQEHRGSLEWIWMHNEYKSWSTSDASRLLYIQGKPGSGKSTLTKYFNHNLLKREPAAHSAIVARFFYSSREGELQRSHYNMLLSILYDILHQDEAFFYHQCQTEYRSHRLYGPRLKWDYTSLKNVINSLQDYLTTNRYYIIIDAVDESHEPDRRDILSLFLELCSKMKYSVAKVFIASRPVAQLEVRRHQLHNFIRLEDETRSDIYNFAHSLLYGLNLTHLLAQATEYILENAQGVFLWVKLVSEELIRSHEEGYSEEEVFELLKVLPTELEDIYARMLEKMKRNKSSLLHGVRMFRLILFARRPLTVDELLHALGVPDNLDPDPQFIPSDDFFEKRIPSSERFIISCGGNFLDIKRQDGISKKLFPVPRILN